MRQVVRCRQAAESHTFAVQNLVARGLGVTLLPHSALAVYVHPDVVVLSPSLGQRHIGVVHRAGADEVPAVRALLARLEEAAGAGRRPVSRTEDETRVRRRR